MKIKRKLLEKFIRNIIREIEDQNSYPSDAQISQVASKFDKEILFNRPDEPILLVGEERGIYIPMVFMKQHFNLSISKDSDSYWDDFEQLIVDINSKMRNGYIEQDGDLWIYPYDYDESDY